MNPGRPGSIARHLRYALRRTPYLLPALLVALAVLLNLLARVGYARLVLRTAPGLDVRVLLALLAVGCGVVEGVVTSWTMGVATEEEGRAAHSTHRSQSIPCTAHH